MALSYTQITKQWSSVIVFGLDFYFWSELIKNYTKTFFLRVTIYVQLNNP